MTQYKHISNRTWFWVALAVLFVSVPNAMVTRIFVAQAVDPAAWVFMRAAVATLVSTPFAIYALRRATYTFTTISKLLMIGIFSSISVLLHTEAIRISSASYVSIVALIYPVILVAVSAWVFKETITRRILAGVGFGILGGIALLIVPVMFSRGSIDFNVNATLLSACNLLFLAIATVMMRQLREKQHVSFTVQIWVSSLVIMVLAGLTMLVTQSSLPTVDGGLIAAVVYSGVIATIIVRSVSMSAYVHLGAATIGVLHYVQVFLSIALPVIMLGETVSLSMVFGGLLILTGVYILEHHKQPPQQH